MVKTKLAEWKINKRQDDVQLMAQCFLHHRNQDQTASFRRCGIDVPSVIITDYISAHPDHKPSDEQLPGHIEVFVGADISMQGSINLQATDAAAQKKRKIGAESSSQVSPPRSGASGQRQTQINKARKPADESTDEEFSSGDDEKVTAVSEEHKRKTIRKAYMMLRQLDSKNTKFTQAVKRARQDLLVAVKDEDKKSDQQHTDFGALHWCAIMDDIKTAELILSRADVNARGGAGHTPLQIAAIRGSYKFLNLLLQQENLNVDVDAVEEIHGFTALMLAIYHNSPPSARLLILKGANVEAGNSKEGTALHLACREPDMIEVIDDILKKASNIDTQDWRLRTPLHYAVTYREEYVMPLLEAGAKLDIADESGRTALIIACFECSEDVLLRLIEKSTNLAAVGNDGETALHILCQRDICEVTKTIVSKPGVNINAKQFNNGCTPLMLAAKANSPRTVQMLVEHKADVDAQNVYLDTALTIAIREGHLEVAKILIENGCSVDPKQRTRAQWSVKLKNDYLLEHAISQSVAGTAARSNSRPKQPNSTIRGSTDHNAAARVEQVVRRIVQELTGGNAMLPPSLQQNSTSMSSYDSTNYLVDTSQVNHTYDPCLIHTYTPSDFNIDTPFGMDTDF